MTRWQEDNMTVGPDDDMMDMIKVVYHREEISNYKLDFLMKYKIEIFTQMVWRRLREIGWENLGESGCTLCWSIFDFMQLWDKV